MDGEGEWIYGCVDTHVMWPDEVLRHDFEYFFGQPMCDHCRGYALDYVTVLADFKNTVYDHTSERLCPNGIRDKRRDRMCIADFLATPEAGAAKLIKAEMAALRLCTSNLFAVINIPLRDESRDFAHTLPATTTCLTRGTKELRTVEAKKQGSPGDSHLLAWLQAQTKYQHICGGWGN